MRSGRGKRHGAKALRWRLNSLVSRLKRRALAQGAGANELFSIVVRDERRAQMDLREYRRKRKRISCVKCKYVATAFCERLEAAHCDRGGAFEVAGAPWSNRAREGARLLRLLVPDNDLDRVEKCTRHV